MVLHCRTPQFHCMRAAPALAAVFALVGPASAGATVVRALTLFQKTQAAELVVVGEVESVEVVWEANKSQVLTLIAIKVDETLKGDAAPGQRLLLRQSGGQIGDFVHRVPGVSKWRNGERAILFLETLGPYMVEIGIGIGKYPVGADGLVRHAPTVAQATVTPTGLQIAHRDPMAPQPVRQFLKLVRGYVLGHVKPSESPIPSREPRVFHKPHGGR